MYISDYSALAENIFLENVCYQSFSYLLQLTIALSLFIDYSKYNEHNFVYFCSSYKLYKNVSKFTF